MVRADFQCCDQVVDEVRLEDDWVPLDEQLSAAELEEVIRSKDARSSAVVLESVSILYIQYDTVIFCLALNNVIHFFSLVYIADRRYS